MNKRWWGLALLVWSVAVPRVEAAPEANATRPAARQIAQGAAVDVYTLQSAVRVVKPGADWTFETDKDDPSAVTLANKKEGLQVVVRWVANSAQMDSKHAAAALESKLMRADNSTGRAFSFLKSRMVGGLPASSFTVDHLVDNAVVHRTRYILVSRNDRCLVVAFSGGRVWLDAHPKQVDALLDGISFVR